LILTNNNKYVIMNTDYKIIKIGAKRCPPCVRFDMALSNIKSMCNYEIVVYDHDKDDIPKEYLRYVLALPTFLIYKEDDFIDKFAGYANDVQFINKVNAIVDTHTKLTK